MIGRPSRLRAVAVPAAPATTPDDPCREQLGELLVGEQRAQRMARQPFGNAAWATRDVSAGISVNPLGRNEIVSLQPSQPSQPIDAKGERCHTEHNEFASRVESRGGSPSLS
jgi:hypothetical protein